MLRMLTTLDLYGLQMLFLGSTKSPLSCFLRKQFRFHLFLFLFLFQLYVLLSSNYFFCLLQHFLISLILILICSSPLQVPVSILRYLMRVFAPENAPGSLLALGLNAGEIFPSVIQELWNPLFIPSANESPDMVHFLLSFLCFKKFLFS
jgi:hypothetical protein